MVPPTEDAGGVVAADAAPAVSDAGGDGAAGCVRKTTGFTSPTAVENFGTGGTWARTEKAATQDEQTASVVVGGGVDHSAALVASGFGFAVPATARIEGVRVRIRRNATTMEVHDREVSLTQDKTSIGNNKAKPDGWASSASEVEYGGENVKWSVDLTPALVNAPTFGVAVAVEMPADAGTHGAYVDVIRIDVAYCE